MKKKISKLALERETLRTLGARVLTQVVAGGGDTDEFDICFTVTKLMANDPKK